jgi:hypothetical protein
MWLVDLFRLDLTAFFNPNCYPLVVPFLDSFVDALLNGQGLAGLLRLIQQHDLGHHAGVIAIVHRSRPCKRQGGRFLVMAFAAKVVSAL